MLDLNVLLGKHITAPLLLYICYLIYKDVTSAKKGDKQSSQEPIPEHREDSAPVNATAQPKWQPIQLMQSIEPISSEPDYKPWEKNEPYPYKPFKPGEYRLTMGVRSLPLENWLVLEDTYKNRIETKWEIIKANYKDVIYHVDPSMVNCSEEEIGKNSTDDSFDKETLITDKDVENCNLSLCELYEHVTSYLHQRFPQYFEVLLSPTEESAGVIHNKILNEFHPLDPFKYLQMEDTDHGFLNYRCMNVDIIPQEVTQPSLRKDKVGYLTAVTCTKTRRAHELILSICRMVEEDLLLLLPNVNKQFDNEYILQSGCFAFAAGFNPRERYLRPLTLVHGPVPEYKKNLQSQMNRFFQTHKQGKTVMRLNFSFQTHEKLYVTSENKGKGDEAIRAKTLEELHDGHDLFYRSERQCLIKIGPQSNAMCFSVKTYLWNIAEQFLQNDYYSQPYVVRDLCDAIKGMQDVVGQYKRKPEWGPALVELLEKRLKNT